MEDSTQGWTQLGPFFSKIKALFSIFKKQQERPTSLPPSCAPGLTGEYKTKALRGDRVNPNSYTN